MPVQNIVSITTNSGFKTNGILGVKKVLEKKDLKTCGS
jgi:hypothetical protein